MEFYGKDQFWGWFTFFWLGMAFGWLICGLLFLIFPKQRNDAAVVVSVETTGAVEDVQVVGNGSKLKISGHTKAPDNAYLVQGDGTLKEYHGEPFSITVSLVGYRHYLTIAPVLGSGIGASVAYSYFPTDHFGFALGGGFVKLWHAEPNNTRWIGAVSAGPAFRW